MLMSNRHMINTFVLNIGTATLLVFVIRKLKYCIEFAKKKILSLTSRFLYLSFLNNVVVWYLSLCDSGSTHSMGFQELFRYLQNLLKSFLVLFRNKLILILNIFLSSLTIIIIFTRGYKCAVTHE